VNTRWMLLGLVLATLLLAGCVERKVTILSEPPAAKVYLDGDYIGDTPVTVPFTFYGTREVQVAKKRYQTQRRQVDLCPPLYERMPIDFVSEVLYPGRLSDHHLVIFRLRPVEADLAALLERARYYRAYARALQPAPGRRPPGAAEQE